MNVGLFGFIFASILAIVSPNDNRVNIRNEKPRIEYVAQEFAQAIKNRQVDIKFKGPAADKLSALMLVVTANSESGFNRRVQTCQKRGDNGTSLTLFQVRKPFALQRRRIMPDGSRALHDWHRIFTQNELCNSVELSAEQAMHIIAYHFDVKNDIAPIAVFNAYVTGSHKKRVREASNRCREWKRLASQFGLRDERKGNITKIKCDRQPMHVVFDDEIDINDIKRKGLKKHGLI